MIQLPGRDDRVRSMHTFTFFVVQIFPDFVIRVVLLAFSITRHAAVLVCRAAGRRKERRSHKIALKSRKNSNVGKNCGKLRLLVALTLIQHQYLKLVEICGCDRDSAFL